MILETIGVSILSERSLQTLFLILWGFHYFIISDIKPVHSWQLKTWSQPAPFTFQFMTLPRDSDTLTYCNRAHTLSTGTLQNLSLIKLNDSKVHCNDNNDCRSACQLKIWNN